MAWTNIEPLRGKPVLPELAVTIAGGASGRQRAMPHIRVTFSAALCEGMGWKAKGTVRVQHDAETGRLRFTLLHPGQSGFRLSPVANVEGALRLVFTLPGQPNERQAARQVTHEVIGKGQIAVRLPAWAIQVAKIGPSLRSEGGLKPLAA